MRKGAIIRIAFFAQERVRDLMENTCIVTWMLMAKRRAFTAGNWSGLILCPRVKKDNGALRDLEKRVRRDLDDEIVPYGDGYTVLELVKNMFPRKRELRIQQRQDMEP